jgi:hypothetical protein
MFALRGLAVSLSVFAAFYFGLSMALSLTWRKVRAASQGDAYRQADFFFALRIFPLAAAIIVTIVLAIPSFLLLEPRAIEEPIGELPLALGLSGLVVLIVGATNAYLAFRRASRTISRWTNGAEPIRSFNSLPIFRTVGATPPMTAVGIIRPKILLSPAVEFLLNASEFQSALNHEIAHVRRHDNLKKLLLRFVPFPGSRELDEAWIEATEVAADDAAVSNLGEALDLAAALIKLCRVGPVEASAELSMSLIHSPIRLVNERVERLIRWTAQAVPEPRHSRRYVWGFGLSVLVAVGLSYGQVLMAVHAATEWLVR